MSQQYLGEGERIWRGGTCPGHKLPLDPHLPVRAFSVLKIGICGGAGGDLPRKRRSFPFRAIRLFFPQSDRLCRAKGGFAPFCPELPQREAGRGQQETPPPGRGCFEWQLSEKAAGAEAGRRKQIPKIPRTLGKSFSPALRPSPAAERSSFPSRIHFFPAAAERGEPRPLPRMKDEGSKVSSGQKTPRKETKPRAKYPQNQLFRRRGDTAKCSLGGGSGHSFPFRCIPVLPLHGSGHYGIHMLD